jgi:hypothetical protein
MKPTRDPTTMTSSELQQHMAELREEITRIWAKRVDLLGHLLLAEASRNMRVPPKALIAYMTSDDRRRVCREFADEIVAAIEAARTMAEVDRLRRSGASVEVH